MEKLTRTFFYQLEKAIKSYRQFAQNRLRENGHAITIDQWLILSVLRDHPEASQNELAELVFKDKASITRIIDLLSAQRYVVRSVDTDNRRKSKLTLTARGKKAVDEILPVVRDYRKAALQGIPKEHLKKTEAVLQAIMGNCEK